MGKGKGASAVGEGVGASVEAVVGTGVGGVLLAALLVLMLMLMLWGRNELEVTGVAVMVGVVGAMVVVLVAKGSLDSSSLKRPPLIQSNTSMQVAAAVAKCVAT